MFKRIIRLLLVALLLGAFVGACGDDDEGGSGSGSASGTGSGTGEGDHAKLKVSTREYAFQLASTSVEGGFIEINLDNAAGKESHEIQLTRLDDGKTLDDYKAAQ